MANNSSRLATTTCQELKFPAPLSYNYSTKLWESIYKAQTFDSRFDFSDNRIPWFRRNNSRPVYPVLDDSITFNINLPSKRVWILPYSSNECPILQSWGNKTKSQCQYKHFWCSTETMIFYEGKNTFDESIKICRGSFRSKGKKCHFQHFKKKIVQ